MFTLLALRPGLDTVRSVAVDREEYEFELFVLPFRKDKISPKKLSLSICLSDVCLC